MDLTEVGLRIKNCRKSLKLTQEELSDRLYLITRYIPVNKRESIADILEVMIPNINPDK